MGGKATQKAHITHNAFYPQTRRNSSLSLYLFSIGGTRKTTKPSLLGHINDNRRLNAVSVWVLLSTDNEEQTNDAENKIVATFHCRRREDRLDTSTCPVIALLHLRYRTQEPRPSRPSNSYLAPRACNRILIHMYQGCIQVQSREIVKTMTHGLCQVDIRHPPEYFGGNSTAPSTGEQTACAKKMLFLPAVCRR